MRQLLHPPSLLLLTQLAALKHSSQSSRGYLHLYPTTRQPHQSHHRSRYPTTWLTCPSRMSPMALLTMLCHPTSPELFPNGSLAPACPKRYHIDQKMLTWAPARALQHCKASTKIKASGRRALVVRQLRLPRTLAKRSRLHPRLRSNDQLHQHIPVNYSVSQFLNRFLAQTQPKAILSLAAAALPAPPLPVRPGQEHGQDQQPATPASMSLPRRHTPCEKRDHHVPRNHFKHPQFALQHVEASRMQANLRLARPIPLRSPLQHRWLQIARAKFRHHSQDGHR